MKLGYSYHGNTFFEHFKKDVKEMKEAGASYLIQTFSENNMQYNRENIKKMNQYAKSEGLEVHIGPWGLAGIFGGEAYSRFALNNIDALQKDNYGKLLPAACLNNRKTRDFIKKWIDTVADLDVDYIFWDEPHFYSRYETSDAVWSCRCEKCQDKFKEKYGYQMPTKNNKDINNFKQDSLKDFLLDIMNYAQNKGLLNGLCVIPPDKGKNVLEEWRRLVNVLPLSYFGTDPYWLAWNRSIEEMVIPEIEAVDKITNEAGIKSQIWIQGFKINNNQINEWKRGINKILQSPIDFVALWSYRCCSSLSYIDYDNSNTLWQIFKDEVKK